MATERWGRGVTWRTVPIMIVVVWFGGILAACGSGATGGPDDDSFDDGFPAPEDPGQAGGPEDVEFTFQLPTGPVGPTSDDDPVFEAFRDQGCADAQDQLDGLRGDLEPRAVLLYQAAIHLCRGDHGQARQQFNQVNMPLWTQACPWYQAIGSVLEQRPPSAVHCETNGREEQLPERHGGDDDNGNGVPEDNGEGEDGIEGDGPTEGDADSEG